MVEVIGETSPETLTGRLGELFALSLSDGQSANDLTGGDLRIPGDLGGQGGLAGGIRAEDSPVESAGVSTLVPARASPVVGPSGLGCLLRSPALGFPSLEDMVDSTLKDNLMWNIHHRLTVAAAAACYLLLLLLLLLIIIILLRALPLTQLVRTAHTRQTTKRNVCVSHY